MAELAERVGEVIEATTTDFVAQCYELYQLPPFGSLVKTRDSHTELYGVVYITLPPLASSRGAAPLPGARMKKARMQYTNPIHSCQSCYAANSACW